MSCKFEDFENNYFANIYPSLKKQLDKSFNDMMDRNEIIDNINANIIGSMGTILAEYHNWLLNNFDISPK